MIDISGLNIDEDNSIDNWVGDFDFLRNDFACLISIDGIDYPSAEHAFQAKKTDDFTVKMQIAACPDAHSAKSLGRTISLPDDWNVLRVSAMKEVITSKFSDPVLMEKLDKTGDSLLQMVNKRDSFWGVNYDGRGDNVLGKILMKVRAENSFIKSTKPFPQTITITHAPWIAPVQNEAPILRGLKGLSSNKDLTNAINELYEAGKKVADCFGGGDKATLGVIAGLIEEDLDRYAKIIGSLGKAVENCEARLQEQESD